MPAQPCEAVPTAHALFDQWKALGLPCLEAGLGADDLVGRNADPLLDYRKGGRALSGETGKFADLAADRHDLEIRGALPSDHADRDGFRAGLARHDLDQLAVIILVIDGDDRASRRDGLGKHRNRRPSFALARGNEFIADAAGRNDVNGKRQHLPDRSQSRWS